MAVTLASKAQVGPFPGSTFGNQNFTVASNSNRVLIAVLETGLNSTVTALAYNGSAMTLLGSDSVAGDVQLVKWYVYYLIAPSTGTNAFSITASGTQDVYCNAYDFYNAYQGGAPAFNKSAIGTTAETATLTASGGEYGVGVAMSGFAVPTGFNLTGDASSNQLGINAWLTGDTNGTVSSGSRTAVTGYTSGGSSVQAAITLISPAASTVNSNFFMFM